MSDEIEVLIAAENWRAARRLIQRRLRGEPENHWLMTRLGLTYYEERDYETSLVYSQKALRLAPRCPLVLWDYAGTLDMLGRKAEAIAAFRRIVRRGVRSLAHGQCGEGLAWARGLVADCLYRLALCYRDLERTKLAVRFLEGHLAQRGAGCRSIYPLAEVRKKYKELKAHQQEHLR
jgi:tetratricopeptide (TPR) repeat protein